MKVSFSNLVPRHLTITSFQDDSSNSSVTPTLNVPAIHAFVALNIIGGIGMLIILITAICSRRVNRLSTWYSFCISWILSCISYTLLFFAGQQTTSNPTWWICFTQTALTYAMPATTTCTTLALLVHILLSFPDTNSDVPIRVNLPTTFMLLTGPYSVFLVLFIGVSLYETRNPATLQKEPRGTYCGSKDGTWKRLSSIVVVVVAVAVIIVQGQLAARIYSSYQSLRRNSRSFVTIFRVTLFTCIAFVTLVVAMIFSISGESYGLLFDLIIAFFPILAVIVFGSQKDICQVWFSRWCLNPTNAKAGIQESLYYGRKSGRKI